MIVVGIGDYLGAIMGTSEGGRALWWLLAYAVFVGLNLWGVELSFKFTVAITFLALGILAVFYVGALTQMDFSRWAFTVEPERGALVVLAQGRGWRVRGVAVCDLVLPRHRRAPPRGRRGSRSGARHAKGIMLGLLTLVICAFCTLVLSVSLPPGAAALGQTEAPLFASLQAIFGLGAGSKILALIAVAGLVASFHSIIFAYGRQIYSLSRAGYFPRFLSVTGKRRTPGVALIVGRRDRLRGRLHHPSPRL